MASGMAAAASPQSSAGWRKERLMASGRAPLPARQEGHEDVVERLVGAHAHVLHVALPAGPPHLLEPPPQHLEVALAHVAPARLDLAAVLHGEEEGWVVEREVELGGVEEVEDGHLVTAAAQVGDEAQHPLVAVEEVGDHHHRGAAAGPLVQEGDRRREPGLPARLERLEGLEDGVHLGGLGPGRERPGDLPGEDGEPGGVLLPDEQVGERAGQRAGVAELGEPLLGPAVAHRAGGVDDEPGPEVGLLLEALHVVLVELAVGLPVDVAQLVAGRVLLVLAELHRLTVVRAAVQAGEHALRGGAHPQAQPGQAGQHRGVEQPPAGLGHFAVSSSRSTTSRLDTPSLSARKLAMTRWASTGRASSRTSSSEAATRPSSTARLLAPSTRYWLARGPAPQAT